MQVTRFSKPAKVYVEGCKSVKIYDRGEMLKNVIDVERYCYEGSSVTTQ